MSRWKKIIGIGMGIGVLAAALLCFFQPSLFSRLKLGKKAEPISRAEAAKETALLIGTREACEESSSGSHFSEEESGAWYVKYADFLYERDLWTEVETPPTAESLEGSYTYSELWGLLERMGVVSEWTNRETDRKDWEQAVPRELWEKVWEDMRLQTGGEVEERELLLYGTPAEFSELPAWRAATDQGEFGFEGLSLNEQADRRIKVWIRGDEILKVEGIVETEVCYANVLITDLEPEVRQTEDGEETGTRLSFFLDGYTKTYHWESQEVEEAYEPTVADVTLSDGKVVRLDLKRESITGKVLAVKEDAIEIQGYGDVPVQDTMRVYKMYGELEQQDRSDIRLGNEVQRFVVADGSICGVFTEKAFEATNIRVLLKTNGFAGTIHDRVELTCDRDFTVTYGEQTDFYTAGQVIAWQPEDACFREGRVTIEPSEGGRIELLSLTRGGGTPVYGGRLELLAAEGGIVVINEILMEEYLVDVLPSEMPESYGLEALKAQAVCARSYACRQMEGNAYLAYGAHVDDSVSFQVYNNSVSSELSRQAVEETYGQVLAWEGQIITAYYFSTSCGHTTDGAAWGGDKTAFPYLSGTWLGEDPAELDLTREEDFQTFIRTLDETAYEASFPWYRWQVTVPLAQMADRIQAYLASSAGSSGTVLVKQADGSFAQGELSSLGDLVRVEVVQRGEGGVAQILEVEGTAGTVRILYQNAIRTVLCDPGYCYTRNGDTIVREGTLLPSAYIYLAPEKEGEILTGYTIYGGGSGHGAGMSQNAACYLGRIGKRYDEILACFYQGCTLARVY